MRGIVLSGLVGSLTGCQNACQELCGRMADYAEECGLPPVSDADMDACVQGQRGSLLEKGDRGVCRDFNDPVIIRAEWQCEDLYEYWAIPTEDGSAGLERRQDPGAASGHASG